MKTELKYKYIEIYKNLVKDLVVTVLCMSSFVDDQLWWFAVGKQKMYKKNSR